MSSGGGEEDHSWPAFVDALTTMTMILTFVMLILAVAIASMADKVSKVLVDSVTEVLDKKVEPNMTPAQLTQELIEEIKRLKKPPPPIQTVPVEAPKKIETKAPDSDPVTPKVDAKREQAMLVLTFPANQTQIDETAQQEIRAYLETSEPAKDGAMIEVRAFASRAANSFSEARRIAYYRAMIVRSQLVSAGIAADRISTKIDEAPSDADGQAVQVFAKAKR